MTVRSAKHRPAAPFVLLLLAVLVYTAFGPVLACQDMTQERPVAAAAAGTVAPEHETARCPGCLPDESPDAESPTRGSAAELPISPAEPGPCTPERPCHGPSGSHAAGDPALRGLDNPRALVPAVVSACLGPAPVERPVLPASTSGPVPPAAVLAPVAVLCVDRN